jgi:hypothetical protein
MRKLEKEFEEITANQLNKMESWDAENGGLSVNPERVRLYDIQWNWIIKNFIPKDSSVDTKREIQKTKNTILLWTTILLGVYLLNLIVKLIF